MKRVGGKTRGHSNNDLWHLAVTASNFHTFHTKAQTILHKSQNDKKTNYISLVSSLLRKSDDFWHLSQIKWGNDKETDAIKSFMPDVASQHDGRLQTMWIIHQARLPLSCSFTRWLGFCSTVVVCQLSKPSVPTVYEMKTFMSRTHFDRKFRWGFVVSVIGFSLFGQWVAPFLWSNGT